MCKVRGEESGHHEASAWPGGGGSILLQPSLQNSLWPSLVSSPPQQPVDTCLPGQTAGRSQKRGLFLLPDRAPATPVRQLPGTVGGVGSGEWEKTRPLGKNRDSGSKCGRGSFPTRNAFLLLVRIKPGVVGKDGFCYSNHSYSESSSNTCYQRQEESAHFLFAPCSWAGDG